MAPHVTAGPWSDVDDRVWFYNLTSECPPDASGRTVVDALLRQYANWFAADGPLAAFDGIQLDVFELEDKRERVDVDCDGVAVTARRDGVDLYLQGQIELTKGIRRILGPSRYLITDSNVGQQPDMASVNGVELEGFPTSSDYAIELWSSTESSKHPQLRPRCATSCPSPRKQSPSWHPPGVGHRHNDQVSR